MADNAQQLTHTPGYGSGAHTTLCPDCADLRAQIAMLTDAETQLLAVDAAMQAAFPYSESADLSTAEDMIGWINFRAEDIASLRAENAKLLAVADAAREVVTPCIIDRRYCVSHHDKLPCAIGALSQALAALGDEHADV